MGLLLVKVIWLGLILVLGVGVIGVEVGVFIGVVVLVVDFFLMEVFFEVVGVGFFIGVIFDFTIVMLVFFIWVGVWFLFNWM